MAPLEKLTVGQLLKKVPTFYKSTRCISLLQEHSNRLCPESQDSSPCFISWEQFECCSPIYTWNLQPMSQTQDLRQEFCMYFWYVPFVLNSPANPIHFDFVILIFLGEEFELWSSSLPTSLQSPLSNKSSWIQSFLSYHKWWRKHPVLEALYISSAPKKIVSLLYYLCKITNHYQISFENISGEVNSIPTRQ
jgi:hypothetical protein